MAIEFTDHKFDKLDPRVLKVDIDHQRILRPDFIRRLRKVGFDPALVGTLLISAREDGYYVVDGQHRQVFAIENDVELVDCEIFYGLKPQDEGHLFLGRNTKTGIRLFDQYRVRSNSGDSEIQRINALIQAAGFVFIARQPDQITFKDFRTALSIVNAGDKINDPEHLENVLAFYGKTFGAVHEPDSDILKGLSKVMRRGKPEPNMERLGQKLSGNPPALLRNRAINHQQEATRGMRLDTACAEIIVSIYNKGLAKEEHIRIT